MQNSALQSRTFSATDALREAVTALQRAPIETASLDARVLLQHVLGVSREQLLDNDSPLTPQQYAHYQELIEKRRRRQPVSQLIGQREFWGMTFRVTGATLDPRPDSETLIEAVLERVKNRQAPHAVLDFGTGTGCLLITLLKEYEHARGTGVDISEEALQVARGNAAALGVSARAEFVRSYWAEKINGAFDVIIANPPYIASADIETLAPEVSRFEPKLALDGGKDGLDCYRAIMPQVKNLLAEGGHAIFEIGMGQERDVADLAHAQGLRVTAVKQDMAGIARCVIIQQPITN